MPAGIAIELASDDGLDAGIPGGIVKTQGSEHVPMVGDGQAGHAQALRLLHVAADGGGPVEKGEVGMVVQMDEPALLCCNFGLKLRHV